MKRIDLTGQRFGRLVVLNEAGKNSHREIVWRCRCDCGKEIEVSGTSLRNGHTSSCGCLRSDNGKKRSGNTGKSAKELTGKRFGRLTVLERVGSLDGHALWHCRCDCGKEVDVTSLQLIHGYSKSCGCLKRENGQKSIVNMSAAAHRDGTNAHIASKKTKSPFGVKGISRHNSPTRPYDVKLVLHGKVMFRKTFATLEEAIAARKAAEEQYLKPLLEKWKIEDEKR